MVSNILILVQVPI